MTMSQVDWKQAITAAVGAVIGAALLWVFGKLGGTVVDVWEQIPKGAVIAFRDAKECPAGAWRKSDLTKGRYIVGLTDGGEPNWQTKNEPLSDKEDRPTGAHVHDMLGTDRTESNDGSAMVYKGGAFPHNAGFVLNHTYKQQTGAAVGAKEGTNAPYVQLLFCEKT
jgi:hypothetical protein